jgi:hypothetical protein
MPDIYVPQDESFFEVGGAAGDFQPAAGPWQMTLEAIYEQDLPSDDQGEPFRGYVTTEGRIISVQFGDLVPLDGQPDAGNFKFFQKFCLVDGEVDITSGEAQTEGTEYQQVNKGLRRLGSLAPALGQTLSTEFVDALTSGLYNNRQVGVIVGARKGARSWVVKFVQAT